MTCVITVPRLLSGWVQARGVAVRGLCLPSRAQDPETGAVLQLSSPCPDACAHTHRLPELPECTCTHVLNRDLQGELDSDRSTEKSLRGIGPPVEMVPHECQG